MGNDDYEIDVMRQAERRVAGNAGGQGRTKQQNVGCLTYTALLFGIFFTMSGLFMVYSIITDMPGRGSMPIAMQWILALIGLFLFGVFPFCFAIRKILSVRSTDRDEQQRYNRNLAEFDHYFQSIKDKQQ